MNVANNIPKNLIFEFSIAMPWVVQTNKLLPIYYLQERYKIIEYINEHTLKRNEKGKYLIFEQF